MDHEAEEIVGIGTDGKDAVGATGCGLDHLHFHVAARHIERVGRDVAVVMHAHRLRLWLDHQLPIDLRSSNPRIESRRWLSLSSQRPLRRIASHAIERIARRYTYRRARDLSLGQVE